MTGAEKTLAPVWVAQHIAEEMAEVRFLSLKERGVFLNFKHHYMLEGSLPDRDETMLRRIAGVESREWDAMRGSLARLFESGWRHQRWDQLREEAIAKRRSGAKGGRASGEARRRLADAPHDSGSYGPPPGYEADYSPET